MKTTDLIKLTAAWDVQFTVKDPTKRYAYNQRAHVLAHTMEDAIAVVRGAHPAMVLVGIQKRAGKSEVMLDRALLAEIRDVEELRATGDLDPSSTAYDMTNAQLAAVIMDPLSGDRGDDEYADIVREAARRLNMSKETPT